MQTPLARKPALLVRDDLDCFHAARISVVGTDPSAGVINPCDPRLDSGLAQNMEVSAQPKVLRLLSDSACLDMENDGYEVDSGLGNFFRYPGRLPPSSVPPTDGDDVLAFYQVTGPTYLSPGVDQGNTLVLLDNGLGLFIRSRLLPPDGSTCGAFKSLNLALQYIQLSLAIILYT